jgi:uncharacterized integral membrane protein
MRGVGAPSGASSADASDDRVATRALAPPRSDWSRYPARTRFWALLVGLLFLVVFAVLYAAPDVALQHWYLFNTPLIIAAFVFGLRGALLGACVAVAEMTVLYTTSMASAHDLGVGRGPGG